MNQEHAGDYDDNGLPKVIWKERKPKDQQRPAQYGLTQLLKRLEIGQHVRLGEFKRSSVYAVARQVGIEVMTTTGTDGIVYVRRTL